MERKEVAAILAMNKANFPNFYKDMGAIETKGLLDSWHAQFKDYQKEVVETAFMEALKVCKFPVTIADIFDWMKRVNRIEKRTVESLWQELLNVSEQVYFMSERFHFNAPGRTEGKTEGQEWREKAERLFTSLDKEIQQYVESLSRLAEFGKMDRGSMEQVIFPSFRRAIENGRNIQEFAATMGQNAKDLIAANSPDLRLLEEA